MSRQESVLRLLLIEDHLEEAERLISTLRNGGIAVRPQRPDNAEALRSLLAERNADLVLASPTARTIPFDEVVRIVNASGKDIPIVATLDTLAENAVVAALAAGARNLALRDSPQHLQHVVRNEFAALEGRRAQRHLEAALRETKRRCDALIASSRDPIAYVHEGMHIRANEAYLEMFGYESFDDIEGLPLLDMIAPSHAGEFKQLLKQLGKGEPPPKTLQLVAQRADGSVFDAVMEFAQASYEGEPCLQIVFRQKTLDADMARELDALRQRDHVTGLYNRQHFLAELEVVVSSAAEGRGAQALLLVQPDNHAALLSEIGLTHADELLVELARRLETALDEHCVAARFSDHSFAVLCRQSDHRRTGEIAERIRKAYHGHIVEVGERSLSLTVSIGGVQIGEKIASLQQVLGKAGQCLQSAGSVGGNRIEIFDPSARDRAEEERVLRRVEEIRQALAGNGMLLHYQPIINLHGEPGETYEAYLRMKGSGDEMVPPLDFLPAAEEHGLLGEIDRWVIGRAIEVLAERRKAGKHTTLFVKISAQSLTSTELPVLIGERLRKLGVPGERLVLQIPEPKVHTHLKAAQEFQRAIAAHGCRLALEQFGSGLNSFQLLAHIDPAFLKIDRSFMNDLSRNAESQKKIREIAGQARAAGKLTVAEFVQDAASMTVLFSSGVDYVEGHFLAPAGPVMNYDFG